MGQTMPLPDERLEATIELLHRASSKAAVRLPRRSPRTEARPGPAVKDKDVKKFHKIFLRIDKECGAALPGTAVPDDP